MKHGHTKIASTPAMSGNNKILIYLQKVTIIILNLQNKKQLLFEVLGMSSLSG